MFDLEKHKSQYDDQIIYGFGSIMKGEYLLKYAGHAKRHRLRLSNGIVVREERIPQNLSLENIHYLVEPHLTKMFMHTGKWYLSAKIEEGKILFFILQSQKSKNKRSGRVFYTMSLVTSYISDKPNKMEIVSKDTPNIIELDITFNSEEVFSEATEEDTKAFHRKVAQSKEKAERLKRKLSKKLNRSKSAYTTPFPGLHEKAKPRVYVTEAFKKKQKAKKAYNKAKERRNNSSW